MTDQFNNMKKLSGLIILFIALKSGGQELYVFSEPASNMPAHSLSAKLTGHFVTNDKIYGRFTQRYMPEVMLGISKKLMVHLSATMSNMHTNNFRFESYSIYAKYRFFSIDDITSISGWRFLPMLLIPMPLFIMMK